MFDGDGPHTSGPETPLDEREDDADEYDGGGAMPPPDDLFRALAAGERRHLLYGLLEEPTRSFEDVTEFLAGRDAGFRGPVGPAGRRRIASQLHHVHLPLLEDAGFLTYDLESGTISLRDVSEHVVDLVRFAREYDRVVGDDSP